MSRRNAHKQERKREKKEMRKDPGKFLDIGVGHKSRNSRRNRRVHRPPKRK